MKCSSFSAPIARAAKSCAKAAVVAGGYVRTARSMRLLILQCAGAAIALVGIAQYSAPIALIIGGVGVVLAVEFQPKRVHDDAKAIDAFKQLVAEGNRRGADTVSLKAISDIMEL